MRPVARAAAISCAVSAVFASTALAQPRSGTQVNSQPPPCNPPGCLPAISSVSAQYTYETGQFSLSVTLNVPVTGAINGGFSTDPSGNCGATADGTGTGFYAGTSPGSSSASLYPPSGHNTNAAENISSDGRTITVTGSDPSMRGRDYRCATASLDVRGGVGNSLTLYFAGFGPGSVECVVPRLKPKTLKAARKSLRTAHCTLGQVRRPSHNAGTLHVSSQHPKAGDRLRAGSKVSLTLK
jgi:hypothetical protein